MIRELVEFFKSTTSRLRPFAGLASNSWQTLSETSKQDTARKSDAKSDALLHNAAILSLALHLFMLLVLPTPGASGETAAPTRIILTSTVVAPEPVPEPVPVVEEVSPPQPEEPEELIPEPEPQPAEMMTGSELQPIEELPTIDVKEGASGPLDAPVENKFNREKIASLLEQTQKKAESQQAQERWLLLEVREKVLNSLSRLLRGNATIHDGNDAASFLLGFRIDAEGWIYDITLRPAPNVTIDAFAIRDAIAVLNPLIPPPKGVSLPIELHLRVDFMEQR
ncbi:MAG: hypothetical protein AAEJ04_00940 [Planctomycetota bacterium]